MDFPMLSEIKKLLESRLSDFQSLSQLDQANKWELYRQNKETQTLVHIKSEPKQKLKFLN